MPSIVFLCARYCQVLLGRYRGRISSVRCKWLRCAQLRRPASLPPAPGPQPQPSIYRDEPPKKTRRPLDRTQPGSITRVGRSRAPAVCRHRCMQWPLPEAYTQVRTPHIPACPVQTATSCLALRAPPPASISLSARPPRAHGSSCPLPRPLLPRTVPTAAKLHPPRSTHSPRCIRLQHMRSKPSELPPVVPSCG
jgi:hypothetical protein